MGYDLNIVMAADDQIDYLKSYPEHTRSFFEAKCPTRTVVETVGKWLSKREVQRTQELELNVSWPSEPPRVTTLYLRDGIYYLLNGTHDKVESVSNFPRVGGRFRGEMLGQAIELGEAYLGYAHAFKSSQAAELKEHVTSIEATSATGRAKTISAEMEWEEAQEQAATDIASLKSVLALAVAQKCGIVWYWA